MSAHPGEEPSGDIIVVSAPRCTLLRAAEELGLCKPYRTGDMTAFSYHDRSNFRDAGRGAQAHTHTHTHTHTQGLKVSVHLVYRP